MSSKKPRILIIDDKPANQLVLNAVLEPDFELLFADSGPLGLARAVEVLPDLILLNLMMAEADAYETCRRINADRRLRNIPVVFAMEQSEPRAAASSGLPWNVADGLTQPIKAEITRRRIRNLLHREHLRRANEAYREQLAKQQQALQESEAFTHTILNSLTEHLAVLDAQGVIVSVNRAWERFAAENSRPGQTANAVGVSYKRVCMAAAGQPGGEEALAAWAGIEAVLSKAQPQFTLEYPCDSPDQSRWFCMRVYPMLAGRQGVVVVHENITERKHAEATLRQSEERLSLILHGTRDGFWDCDLVRNEVYYSPRCWNMLGYQEGELAADADLWQHLIHPDDLERVQQVFRAALAEGSDSCEVEFRLRHKDGHYLNICSRAVILRDEQGKTTRISGANMDMTARQRAEEALREQEEFFRLITENLQGFVAVLDTDGRRIYNSPHYAPLLGNRSIAGASSFEDIHPDDRERVTRVFRDTVATGVGHHLDYRFLTADGGIRLMESRGCVIRDNQGRTKCVVVISQDVTKRKENEEKIHRLAFYDALTKLPNRVTLYDRLRQAMAASKRRGGYAALMFVDLDNFKPANDRYGHEVGDLLLIEAANRLTSCIREVDTVARFGGDEFVVILSDLHADQAESTTQATIVAEKIRSRLAAPYRLTMKHDGQANKTIETMETLETIEYHCTASIGVALFLDHQGSPDDIVKWADAAMYEAKEAGRNSIRVYDTPRQAVP